jgi:hypothetical protein
MAIHITVAQLASACNHGPFTATTILPASPGRRDFTMKRIDMKSRHHEQRLHGWCDLRSESGNRIPMKLAATASSARIPDRRSIAAAILPSPRKSASTLRFSEIKALRTISDPQRCRSALL